MMRKYSQKIHIPSCYHRNSAICTMRFGELASSYLVVQYMSDFISCSGCSEFTCQKNSVISFAHLTRRTLILIPQQLLQFIYQMKCPRGVANALFSSARLFLSSSSFVIFFLFKLRDASYIGHTEHEQLLQDPIPCCCDNISNKDIRHKLLFEWLFIYLPSLRQ